MDRRNEVKEESGACVDLLTEMVWVLSVDGSWQDCGLD